MNRKQIKFGLSCVSLLFGLSVQAHASMLGLCNDARYTQYICCPANGGWIVSSECASGASTYCENGTGQIAGSNPPVTILQDCQNRGGTSVSYYVGDAK